MIKTTSFFRSIRRLYLVLITFLVRRSSPIELGRLDRTDPVSANFGLDRGKPIDRYYIENFLSQNRNDIQGRALEIADNTYTKKFGDGKIEQSDVLHAVKGNSNATIVADLRHADDIPSDSFDCIILTQTLQFIYDVRSAIGHLYRILKPNGVLLVTMPGISQIARGDMDRWGEYWRFTTASAQRLFEEKFLPENVEVKAYGNILVATAFLNGLAVEDLKLEQFNHYDPDYQMIIAVRAVKSEINTA